MTLTRYRTHFYLPTSFRFGFYWTPDRRLACELFSSFGLLSNHRLEPRAGDRGLLTNLPEIQRLTRYTPDICLILPGFNYAPAESTRYRRCCPQWMGREWGRGNKVIRTWVPESLRIKHLGVGTPVIWVRRFKQGRQLELLMNEQRFQRRPSHSVPRASFFHPLLSDEGAQAQAAGN